MYRIRFHGRGGQGMKTASRILGTAFFLEGFEVQDAPRYGAERRGAPIFAYVRAAHAAIHERGIIRWPDLVVVADDTLVPIPAAGVLAGVDEHTTLLLYSNEKPEVWRHRLGFAGPVLTLPDRSGTERPGGPPLMGSACTGAAARLLGVISRTTLERAIREELAPLGAAIVESNLRSALGAYDGMADHHGAVMEGRLRSAADYVPPAWVDLPAETARVASPTIHAAATSELVKTGLWRTLRPVIDYDRCNRCWWICSTLCPEGVVSVDPEGHPRIDYEHCKGCLVCVAQCPTHVIAAVPERLMAQEGEP